MPRENKAFVTANENLVDTSGDGFVITTEQEIPAFFTDRIADQRTREPAHNARDEWQVADIPVAVVNHWMRQGFDIFRADAREILQRLAHDNLGAFITTGKRI